MGRRRPTATLRLLTATDVLLADVVSTSAAVAATSARSAKIAAVAELLRQVPPPEVTTVVAYLSGEARQGRIGVGWAALGDLQGLEPAPVPTLDGARGRRQR